MSHPDVKDVKDVKDDKRELELELENGVAQDFSVLKMTKALFVTVQSRNTPPMQEVCKKCESRVELNHKKINDL
jgi:hypothetical protein